MEYFFLVSLLLFDNPFSIQKSQKKIFFNEEIAGMIPKSLKQVHSVHQSILMVYLHTHSLSLSHLLILSCFQSIQSLFGETDHICRSDITLTDIGFTLEAVLSILVHGSSIILPFISNFGIFATLPNRSLPDISVDVRANADGLRHVFQ